MVATEIHVMSSSLGLRPTSSHSLLSKLVVVSLCEEQFVLKSVLG